MSDENKQDAAEPTPASDGSVAASVEVYIDKSACGFPESRPLRRPQPTLTDAEREAISLAVACAEDGVALSTVEASSRVAATLRGLLERTK